jgi:hypothetical protein
VRGRAGETKRRDKEGKREIEREKGTRVQAKNGNLTKSYFRQIPYFVMKM